MRSNFSVWALVVLTSSLLKNGDAFTIVQHVYNFTENDVRLDCPFLEGPRIVWKEIDVGEIIAINGSMFSTNAKYNNFDVSSERNISSLFIYRAEMEDDGVYSCHDPTGRSLSFWLHMQNPPTLSISVNGKVVNISIDVDENTEIIIECNSTGADPLVSVSLTVDDEPLTLEEQTMDNYTHTAYASSRLTVRRSHREIVCIDSEQKLPMYKKTIYLNVNYKNIPVYAIVAITIVILVVVITGYIIYKHKDISVLATFAIGIVILVGLIIGYIIYKRKDIPFLTIFAISIVILAALTILNFIFKHKEICLPVFTTLFTISMLVLLIMIQTILKQKDDIPVLTTVAITTVIMVVLTILSFIYKLTDKDIGLPVLATFAFTIVILVGLIIGYIIYMQKDIEALATFAITIVILVVLIIGNIIYKRRKNEAGFEQVDLDPL